MTSASPLSLWYSQPARVWTDALPVGNGRLGAMIFGGIALERIQFNEDTFWSGQPYDASNPEAKSALSEVRRLVFEGRYAEAEALTDARLLGKPLGQSSFQPLADLHISTLSQRPVTAYRRELDLDTGVASCTFVTEGVTFRREVFASAPAGVIVIRLQSSKPGAIDATLSLSSPHGESQPSPATNSILVAGNSGGPGRNSICGAIRFEARAVVLTQNGAIQPSAGAALDIQGADAVTVLLDAATSFQNYRKIDGDPAAQTQARLKAAMQSSYDELKLAAIAEHRRLFRRVSLDLGSTSAVTKPTNERLQSFAGGSNDPQLIALYYQYARYLLIASSRPGTQPANLQGLWNDQTTPPWDSKYTININTQMNYWMAESANLGELVDPLRRMIEDLTETGRKVAQVHYGARGWVTHHNTDIWRAAAPIDGAFWGMWPTGGAWLCTHLWEHYLYSGDASYLAEVYPILKGAAEFFLDALIDDPNTGHLVTNPSISPENKHPHGSSICAGPTMDMAILRDLFQETAEAAEILETDEDFRRDILATRDRLAPYHIGHLGHLQEWQHDWDASVPEPHHRHVSHLYGLFPSAQIDIHDTPVLARAASVSLDMRGDYSTGWAIAWRINLWARLHDGERTYAILKALLDPSRTYNNLFDAHPPFQIDGNFGGASGITEMLLQSHRRLPGSRGIDLCFEIELLPALPQAWPSGAATGLRARGGIEVDISWESHHLKSVVLRSTRRTSFQVRYGDQTLPIELRAGETWSLEGNRLSP